MATELRKTGISVVGDIPWGTHFCHFYETNEDLLDILIPYFTAGLENNEFCMWVVSDPLGEEEARNALRQAVPEADQYLASGRIEIVLHTERYFKGGAFVPERVINGWNAKLDDVLAKGYAGLRVNANVAWLTKEDWKEFSQYEKTFDETLANRRMIALCSYPLTGAWAAEIFDVVHTHQFAIARRQGNWDVLEAPEMRQAKREIKRLNEELEQRVIERTEELAAANEELRREITERKRVEEALKESQRKLEEAQRIAHVGHWERDLDTGAIVWSDEIYRILGLPPQEADSPLTEWHHLLHPEDRERVALITEEAQRGVGRYDVEYRIVRHDGEVRFLHSQGDIVRDEQGRSRRAFGIAQDITERKRVEEALRESEELYRFLTENTHDVVSLYDVEGRRVYLSPAYSRVVGWLPDETFGGIHPDDLQTVRQYWQRILAGEKIFLVYRHAHADGSWRWMEVWGSLMHYQGRPHVMAVTRDITERKLAEEALKESQRKLEEAQRIAHVGHWERDLDTSAVLWSDEIYRIFGLPTQENVSPLTEWQHMLHPGDRERVLFVIGEAHRGARRYVLEYRIVRHDGEVRFLHTQGNVIRDEQGRPCRAFGITQDITGRKLAEEALMRAEEKYHGIFEHAIEGIFQTTPAGQYITANPALARMLGYDSPQELIGSRTDIGRQQYVEPECRSEFKRLLEEQSVVQGFEYQAYRKDGSKIWLSDNGRAVRDESGAVLYYEGFTEDITERKLAEEALKKEREILKKIFDNVPVLIGFVGEDGRVKLVNPEWERTVGWTLKELQEQDVDIFAEAYPDLSYRQDVLDFIAASTGEWVDLKIKVRDGRVIDAASAVVHLSDGTKVAIAQNITERKLVEEMLQTFSQRLIETQEAERRRVARELHDEIGQALTALKINLQAVQHSAGDSPLAPQLNESTGIVDRALQQVRDLSLNLRPSLLDDLGLTAALRWYLDREARRAGLIPEFAADLSETRLPQELETACFRITQEALTNVVRHAQASRVWVELRQRGAELSLLIRDDGIGFDMSAVRSRRSADMNLGLQGMQERALIFGGRIEIQSTPGRGTEIHVWFPLTLSYPPQRRGGAAR